MGALFHQHLLVKAWVMNPPRSEDEMNQWLRDLVSAIDMKVCIEPRTVYVDNPGNKGLTAQIGIETSHIAIHVWDETSPGMIQMDVYSCKCFDHESVLLALDDFDMVGYELMAIDRNDGFKVTEHAKVSQVVEG